MDITAFPRQFARTRHFSLGVPRAFTISPDGERVLFLRTRDGEDRVSCLWLLADGQERLLVDPVALGDGPQDLPEVERARRERARELATGLVAYSADAAAATVAFALHGTLWVAGTDGTAPRQIPAARPSIRGSTRPGSASPTSPAERCMWRNWPAARTGCWRHRRAPR